MTIEKYYIYVIAVLLCFNCSRKPSNYGVAKIDKTITKDSVDDYLRKSNQKFIYKNIDNSEIKRTVEVDHSIERKDFKTDDQLSQYYQCTANIKDTLSVKIGVDGGLGGYGFYILYKDEKFKVKPYIYSDQKNRQKKMNTDVIYQNLVLDKSQYKVGDSIYGKVDFKIIETDQNKIKTAYKGKASFATTILK